jgi:N-hydroxyarylamine O-acetyltransferase
VAKIVDRRRGGFCYGLNGAFATLLRALRFEVTLLAARVHGDDGIGPPFDHMCLRVELEEPWLADVGFGDNFRLPLRLNSRDDQVDDAGTFRIVPSGGPELDLLREGEPQYRFDLTPRDLLDYDATCRYHQASPESHAGPRVTSCHGEAGCSEQTTPRAKGSAQGSGEGVGQRHGPALVPQLSRPL